MISQPFVMKSFRKAQSLSLAILVMLLTTVLVCAQETTGGGSTEDFKRPANPPVHRRPIPNEAAGGRITGAAASKPSGRTPAPGVANAAGIEPGAARSEPRTTAPANTAAGARPSATPRPTKLGGIGDSRSGVGRIESNSRPATQPKPSVSPVTTNTPTPDPLTDIGDVEDAIEAGNDARDRKPPNYVEAERAYRLAAKLAPKDERPFIGLGNIYYDQKRDLEGIAAYRKAVEVQPKNRSVWDAMGDLYFRLGRYEESIEATTQLGLHTDKPGPFWTLVWASLSLGKGEDAGHFANGFIDRWKPFMEGDTPYYIVFGGYLGYREAGLKERADELLREPGASSQCPDQNWHCRLFKYLRHEVTAQQLLSEANTNDKMTEARTYIGIDLALTGRRAEALPHFRWVVESGNREFVEYHLAKAWMARPEKP